MLDPITAISLASNIAGFVDLASRLLDNVSDLAKSADGVLSANRELETTTTNIRELNMRLSNDRTQNKAIRDLVEMQDRTCNELLSLLQDLKAPNRRRCFDVVLPAVRALRKSSRIKSLQENLGRLQKTLTMHLVAEQRDQQSNYTSLLQIVELFAYELPEKVEQNKEEIVKAIERLALPDAHYSLLGDLSKRLDNLAKDGMVKSILRSLGYAQMSARQSHIPEAHQKTFEWAFESPEIHFLDWLESTTGGDMFWISGKAGSGKSTLMKFLYEHQRTKSALKASAGPDKQLVIARHFFWSAGSETQKSQEGLLRSLLHDIFRQCPSLIPLVCSTQIQDDMNLGNPQPWSLKQLRKSFLKFLQLDSESSIPSIVASTRFCLFVDGLDEYDGNLADLIDLFQWKSRTPFIKICLSSRPRDVFDKAFHGKDHQKLKLQDLTKGDIQRYISDNLIDNKSGWDFNKLDQRFLDLINQITAKAEGVFLWVFLVVRSLLEGLENEDSISILEERVKEIPADLESYFQRVLDGIAKIYRRDTAHLLRIMLYRNEPLPLISLHVAMEHGNCDIEAQQGSSTDEWAIRMNDSLKKRVYARCRDLVDIDLDSKKTFTASQGL